QTESRVGAGQSVVADERELEPTAQAVAVDRGDEERVHALHRRHRVLPRDEVLEVKAIGGESLQIDAGAEGPPGAGDHHDTRVERGQRLDRGAEVAYPRRIAGVEDFGAIQREAGDRALVVA